MVSRQTLERISTLAIVDRITGESRYGARAIEEMLSVSAFSDWNPSHFLDSAECRGGYRRKRQAPTHVRDQRRLAPVRNVGEAEDAADGEVKGGWSDDERALRSLGYGDL